MAKISISTDAFNYSIMKSGLKLQEISAKTGVSVPALSNLKHKGYGVSLNKIWHICDVLNIKVDFLNPDNVLKIDITDKNGGKINE